MILRIIKLLVIKAESWPRANKNPNIAASLEPKPWGIKLMIPISCPIEYIAIAVEKLIFIPKEIIIIQPIEYKIMYMVNAVIIETKITL